MVIYLVESPDKIYGCEFIEKKEVRWIYLIETAEKSYN